MGKIVAWFQPYNTSMGPRSEREARGPTSIWGSPPSAEPKWTGPSSCGRDHLAIEWPELAAWPRPRRKPDRLQRVLGERHGWGTRDCIRGGRPFARQSRIPRRQGGTGVRAQEGL